MKFRVMIGALPKDGFVQVDDHPTHGHLNFYGTKPEFDGIWKVEYDDDKGLNYVELSPPEFSPNGVRPTRADSLTTTEITWWKDWVATIHNEETARKIEEEKVRQRAADEDLIAEFGDWTLNNKVTRDNLLITSDAYEMLEHLKSEGWSDWRQWLRDLPDTNPDPLTIEFKEPPANANAAITRSFSNWKQRITFTKEVKEKL
tara:strand:+ start:252 stop:857 length:606 start_codon:yes stop_codon:yes gene_type:complete